MFVTAPVCTSQQCCQLPGFNPLLPTNFHSIYGARGLSFIAVLSELSALFPSSTESQICICFTSSANNEPWCSCDKTASSLILYDFAVVLYQDFVRWISTMLNRKRCAARLTMCELIRVTCERIVPIEKRCIYCKIVGFSCTFCTRVSWR